MKKQETLVLLASIIFTSIFIGCNAQSNLRESCKKNLKDAESNLAYFSIRHDSSRILSALREVDSAMQCSDTKNKAILFKIAIYEESNKYDEGNLFVTSLNETDFKYKYVKKMWQNYFSALGYDSKMDTINSYKYYNKAITCIQDYINQQNFSSDRLNLKDIETYGIYSDLFNMKSKILNTNELNKEYDMLEKANPEQKPFFENIRTFHSEGRIAPITSDSAR